MKKWFVLIVVVILSSCGGKTKNIYYPKAHYTPMILDQSDKKVVYLDWGVPLAYGKKMQTNIEVAKNKTNQVIYVLVQNKNTKQMGWVNLASVVKDPIAKATLLNTAQVYKTPNEVSREFFTMTAPMLGYVVEIQNGWARVQWYMAAYKVFTKKTEWTTYEWIPLQNISTNTDDADLLSLAYTTYEKLSEWQMKWPTLTQEKIKLAMSNEIATEIIYLENVLKKYGGVYGPTTTAVYVNDLLISLKNLIYPPQDEEGYPDEYGYEDEHGYEGEY